MYEEDRNAVVTSKTRCVLCSFWRIIYNGRSFSYCILCLCLFRLHPDEDKPPAAGGLAAAEEMNKNGNNIGNGGAGGAGEHGRLGTPAFINLPETHPLNTNEIEEIAKEIELENELQVRVSRIGIPLVRKSSARPRFSH